MSECNGSTVGGYSGNVSRADSTPSDFRGCCVEKLEKLSDSMMDSKNYDKAIKLFSNILTLDPTNPCDILLKRSEAQIVMGSWKEALIDADKVWVAFHVTSNRP